MKVRYPLKFTNDRELPADFNGNVFIWDIDKTYLATHFSSLGGLARIPIEFAIDKESIVGMPEVLRGIRRGSGPTFAAAPLYFISSSPPQLKPVISKKMLLDGVQPDGFTFKDWVATLRQLKPKRLKDHLAYKLCALLYGRSFRPQATEYLFGDDVERDAEAYSMYSSILKGDINIDTLDGTLASNMVPFEDRQSIIQLVLDLPKNRGSIGKIFIHLARGTDPKELNNFGPLITPVRNSFQLSLVLYELKLVDNNTVFQTATSLRKALGQSQQPFEETLDDAIRRRLVTDKTLNELRF